jgi:hypothetical protein
VAIVQISRITARKGLQVDLPQPLAGAELGWAVDDRRLFIGNGTLDEGAPVVGNTEILTEFSDILSFAGQYTYKGDVAGYTVQTGSTAGSPVSQSIQSRLDSYAVVTDFGATGNGVTDDTDAINRALQQLYCIQNNTQIRRSLFFPAGTYVITDTILVPPYARLYGEGALSSIISFQVQNWAANTAYAANVLVYNVANSTYYRSQTQVPATGIAVSNLLYWAAESLPAYVARTTDNLQQTGVNIATNGAIAPVNVEISSMAIVTNQIHTGSVLLIEKAEHCFFNSVDIIGPLTTADLTTNIDDTRAVDWSSTSSLPCQQINFDNCRFSGFTYAVNTAQQINGAVISNSQFDTLYQGVILGGASPVNGGATGVKLMHNIFDAIYEEGIYINNVSLNGSGYNIFYDVGNHFSGATSPASAVITIDAINNISVGDMFQRTTAFSGTYPRIKIFNAATQTVPASIGIDSAAQIQMGSFVRETGTQATLSAGATATTLFTVSSAQIKAFSMEYTITRETSVRTGTITVVNDADDSAGDGLSYTDDFVQNSDPDVTLEVTDVAGTMSVLYTSSAARAAGKIYYSLTHLGRSY